MNGSRNQCCNEEYNLFFDCPLHEVECYYTECSQCSAIDSDCGQVKEEHIYMRRAHITGGLT